jgi:selenocysteine lyase/cysteine desulfurase
VVASEVNAHTSSHAAAAAAATSPDVVLFCGNGATAASNKLVRLLGLCAPLPRGTPASTRPLVLIGPHEHHSNMIPWRESCATVLQLPEAAHGRGVCLVALKAVLDKYGAKKRSGPSLIIGAFSGASNVTGVVEDVERVTRLLHAAGALAVWDYAASACGGPAMDMNPRSSASSSDGDASKDAMFFSPHKLAGGPGAPGVLVVKRALLRNAVPERPGGGTVFWVTDKSHVFLTNKEEREEGGTPDVLGALRCAAALRTKGAAERAARAAEGAEEPAAPAPEGMPQRAPRCGVAARASALAARMHASLAANPSICVLGPPMRAGEHRVPTLSFLIRAPPALSHRWLHPNFVCATLNDVFGLQTRGGCACAGPYGTVLLGISDADAAKLARELVFKETPWRTVVKPGWTRLSLPWFASEAEAGYALAAVHAIATHGWRLLPLYRWSARCGSWRHAGRDGAASGLNCALPPRKTLAAMRWPLAEDDAAAPLDAEDNDADGARAARGGAQRTPAAEAALEAAYTRQLAAAGAIFADASAAGAVLAATEFNASSPGVTASAEALRWFTLPEEAAHALAAERAIVGSGTPPGADALAAGAMRAGEELPPMCAAAPKSVLHTGPLLGPVRPKRYAADSSSSKAFAPAASFVADDQLEAPSACAVALCGLVSNASIAVRVMTDPMWAAASRKHQLRSADAAPAHADAAAFRGMRYGAERSAAEDADDASSCDGSDDDGEH